MSAMATFQQLTRITSVSPPLAETPLKVLQQKVGLLGMGVWVPDGDRMKEKFVETTADRTTHT